MDLYNFLETDKRYCLYILEILSSKGNHFLSVPRLMEILGVSKFKVTKYLEDVKSTVSRETVEGEILIFENGEVDSINLNKKDVKRIRLGYLESSLYFQLFKTVLGSEKGLDMETSMEQFYLTKKKYYEERKVFINIIKGELEFKKNRFQGEEQEIRLFSLGMFYFFYNDIRSPFVELENSVEVFVDKLATLFQIKMSRTKRTKLVIYISLCFIRMKSRYFMKGTFLEEQVLTTYKDEYYY